MVVKLPGSKGRYLRTLAGRHSIFWCGLFHERLFEITSAATTPKLHRPRLPVRIGAIQSQRLAVRLGPVDFL